MAGHRASQESDDGVAAVRLKHGGRRLGTTSSLAYKHSQPERWSICGTAGSGGSIPFLIPHRTDDATLLALSRISVRRPEATE